MKKTLDVSLYLVTDPHLLANREMLQVIRRALEGGTSILQLRDKTADDASLLRQGQALQELCREFGVPFIMNDRPDLAAKLGADGVHVGQKDLNLAQTRHIVGPQAIIGVSVSTVEEAVEAAKGGADYLGISPVFTTPTKTDTPQATGLSGLRAIRQAVSLPLVAIGGVDARNAAEVLAAGADGLAVIRAILGADDPRQAARELADLLKSK